MSKIHGGQIAAKYLREVEGIDTIFALSGGHIAPIFDGCLDHGVKIIDVRHEQAAVMMAQSWSIYTGKPGVCLVTAGPGFTNSLTGVVNAFMENAPVVIISGMAAIRTLDMGVLQDIDQQSMIKPTVKWAARCHHTERIPEYLEMAIRHAVSGRPGPTFLEITPESLYRAMDEQAVAFPAKGDVKYRVVPEEESIDQAVEILKGAERPLLVGGSGISASGAEEVLRAFVEKNGIPFMLLDNGRGAVPDEHPLSLWDGGIAGLIAAMTMADVVLAVGVRFNWSFGFGATLANARVIRVDIDAVEVNRNRKADVPLVGDAGAVLGLLNEKMGKADHPDWMNSLRGVFTGFGASDKKLAETSSDPIHPVRLMHQIRQATKDDAIFIIDGGDTAYYAMVGLRAKYTAGVIGSGSLFGCLGTGVPFAIGAKVACPDKPVVLVTGDGSFGLNGMEMETSSRHGAPVVVVICNDQAWGMVKHHQEMCFEETRVCGTELGVIHYEKIVEALGGHGEFVDRDADILPALERALASGKPACVNVITDPTVVSPASLAFAQGFKTLK